MIFAHSKLWVRLAATGRYGSRTPARVECRKDLLVGQASASAGAERQGRKQRNRPPRKAGAHRWWTPIGARRRRIVCWYAWDQTSW